MMSSQEVPQGYKQTKVGVVPVEWEEMLLSTFVNEKVIYCNDVNINLGSLTIENGVVPKPTRYKREHLVKDTTDAYKLVEYKDFVYNPMNLRFGALALYSNIKKLKVSAYYNIFNVDESIVDIEYIYAYLKSKRIMFYYNRMATGSLEEKKRVHFKEFKKFIFPLPPLKEQQKIAQILTTWDKAIEKLEALIEEKERLKKGLMQRLLSGEVRFEGFDEEWEEVRLRDILFEQKKDKVSNPQNYELLTVKLHCKGIIKTGKLPNITANGRPYYFVEKGELLIGRQNFHNGGFGISNFESDRYITSNAISHYKVKNNLSDLNFLRYYFSQYNFYKRVDYIIGGTGQKEISKKEFYNLKIKLPLLKEQQKIAQVLTTADKEIELLKKELEVLKEQKRGLMQKLLTGEVRVKHD